METGEHMPEKGKKEGKQESDLIALVKQMQEEIASLKATKATEFNPTDFLSMMAKYQTELKNQEKIDYEEGIRAEDIPVDDYIENGVVFSAPSVGMCIVDDRRMGHRVVLPYGKKAIMFIHTATRHVKRDKYTELVTMCSYKSHSKAEVEWLRKHSLYNAVFYETTKGVIGAEIQNATRIARILGSLNQIDMPSIVKRCKEYKVPVTDDIATMRAGLAVKMSEAEAKSEETVTHKRLQEIEKEKEMLLASR